MIPPPYRCPLLALGCAALFASPVQAQLYADFRTNFGDFSVELYFQDTPRTVANFVALAEGTQPWLDARTNKVRAGVRFYDGLTFHRVLPNFMIQAGSPLADGTDGPGYVIPDEFRKNESGDLVHKHLGPGVLSMANINQPNSGHSQFFITLSSQPALDHLHTVFGKVSTGPAGTPTFAQGMAVVTAIADTPRDSNDKPQSPVTIEYVRIRREGAAAQAFDPSVWQLPQVRGPTPVDLRRQPPEGTTPERFLLDFNVPMFHAYHYLFSDNLAAWRRLTTTVIIDRDIPTAQFDVTPEATGPAGFFQLIDVDYSALVGAAFVRLSTAASVKFTLLSPALNLTINRAGDVGTWTSTTSTPASGAIERLTYGAGPGDAGLFSPDMTVIFGTAPFEEYGSLALFTPTLTFDAGSSTRGSFVAGGKTLNNIDIEATGVFHVLVP